MRADIRVAERLEDRVGAQAFHAKSACHGMRRNAKTAQLSNLKDGFDQRSGVRYFLRDVEREQVAFGGGHLGAGDDFQPVGGRKFQCLERTLDFVMVGDGDHVQPDLSGASKQRERRRSRRNCKWSGCDGLSNPCFTAGLPTLNNYANPF
jgi:hypothetical protein